MRYLAFIGLFLTLSEAEAQICFQDVPSFEAVRSELPAILQNFPLYAIHQSFELTGGFEIIENGNTFQINADLEPLFGSTIKDSATVTEACLNGNQLQVTLNNGTTETITVNASSFTIENFQFNITDLSGYDGVISQIN